MCVALMYFVCCSLSKCQTLTALKKRKLIKLVTRKSHKVQKGSNYQPKRVRKAADLTKELLDSGAWQTTPFKPYNFQTLGEKPTSGYLHPLLKVRAEVRKILLQELLDLIAIEELDRCVFRGETTIGCDHARREQEALGYVSAAHRA